MHFDPSRLRKRRREVGMSIEHVAVGVGRSYQSVGNYERGVHVPPADVVGAIAALLGCAVSDFYDEDKVPAA